MEWAALPSEILIKILGFVDYVGRIKNCRLVCRSWEAATVSLRDWTGAVEIRLPHDQGDRFTVFRIKQGEFVYLDYQHRDIERAKNLLLWVPFSKISIHRSIIWPRLYPDCIVDILSRKTRDIFVRFTPSVMTLINRFENLDRVELSARGYADPTASMTIYEMLDLIPTNVTKLAFNSFHQELNCCEVLYVLNRCVKVNNLEFRWTVLRECTEIHHRIDRWGAEVEISCIDLLMIEMSGRGNQRKPAKIYFQQVVKLFTHDFLFDTHLLKIEGGSKTLISPLENIIIEHGERQILKPTMF